jgi:hypothetical protein
MCRPKFLDHSSKPEKLKWIKITEANFQQIKKGDIISRKNPAESSNLLNYSTVGENKFSPVHTYTIEGLTAWPEQHIKLRSNDPKENDMEITTEDLLTDWWLLDPRDPERE